MNAVFVTLSGVIGTDPKRGSWKGQALLTFRMVSNERKWDVVTRTWVDVHSSWMQVSCFGALAHHVDASVRKGDRIVVHGKLRVNEYVASDGGRRTSVDVVADCLGPDLTFGEARVRPRRQEDTGERLRQHAEELAREFDDEPRLSVAELIALRADQADDGDWDAAEIDDRPVAPGSPSDSNDPSMESGDRSTDDDGTSSGVDVEAAPEPAGRSSGDLLLQGDTESPVDLPVEG